MAADQQFCGWKSPLTVFEDCGLLIRLIVQAQTVQALRIFATEMSSMILNNEFNIRESVMIRTEVDYGFNDVSRLSASGIFRISNARVS